MGRHIISDDDLIRLHEEGITHQVASGPGRDGRKRIVARIGYDNSIWWIVVAADGTEAPYRLIDSAVEAYNKL
jgi:hypothetical protein